MPPKASRLNSHNTKYPQSRLSAYNHRKWKSSLRDAERGEAFLTLGYVGPLRQPQNDIRGKINVPVDCFYVEHSAIMCREPRTSMKLHEQWLLSPNGATDCCHRWSPGEPGRYPWCSREKKFVPKQAEERAQCVFHAMCCSNHADSRYQIIGGDSNPRCAYREHRDRRSRRLFLPTHGACSCSEGILKASLSLTWIQRIA